MTEFESQLVSFKNNLTSLYKKKASLIAERETKRFQYISSIKAKLATAISRAYDKVYADRDVEGQNLFSIISGFLLSRLPMVNNAGQDIEGYAGNFVNIGGRLNVGFLSPINHILVDKFSDESDSDPSPFYKVHEDQFTYQAADSYLNLLLINNLSMYGEAGPIIFSMPPSRAWVESYIMHAAPYDSHLLHKTDYVINLISESGFADSYNEALNVLYEIVEKTSQIILLQVEIDKVEKSLTDYIAEFGAHFGFALTAADVMREIQEESEKSDMFTSEAATEGTIIQSAPQVSSEGTVTPIKVPSKKSSVPWLAAAAVGILLLTSKK